MRFFAGLGTLTVHERAPGDIAGGLAAAEREDSDEQDEQCGDGGAHCRSEKRARHDTKGFGAACGCFRQGGLQMGERSFP